MKKQEQSRVKQIQTTGNKYILVFQFMIL